MTLSAKWVSMDVNLPQLSLSIQNSGQLTLFCSLWASQVAQWWKYSPANAGDTGDKGLISGSGRSPGGGNGNLLQYSCLENPMDRRAWRLTVNAITELDMTERTHTHMHTYTHTHTPTHTHAHLHTRVTLRRPTYIEPRLLTHRNCEIKNVLYCLKLLNLLSCVATEN